MCMLCVCCVVLCCAVLCVCMYVCMYVCCVVLCICCVYVVLSTVQRATKLDFLKNFVYFCFIFMKVYRWPQCKGRRAVFSSSLFESPVVTLCTSRYKIKKPYLLPIQCIYRRFYGSPTQMAITNMRPAVLNAANGWRKSVFESTPDITNGPHEQESLSSRRVSTFLWIVG